MFIQRTIPPAAAPIHFEDIICGLKGLFLGQKETERFKLSLKEYFGVRHCFLVSSGKAALSIILQALNEICPDKDEVLIPAFTCFSVPSAIVNAGLKVRLCDLRPDTLDFDFEQLPGSIFEAPDSVKPNTRLLAAIPIHLFGIPADISRMRELISNLKITIVEDAAQGMGGKWQKTKLGVLGDVSFFSLGRGKSLSTVEGGIILTDRDDISSHIKNILTRMPSYRFIEKLRLILSSLALSIFLHPVLFWVPKALPFLKLGETIYDPDFNVRPMTSFQAGLARNWRKKLRRSKTERYKCVKVWSTLFQKSKNYGPAGTRNVPGDLNLIRFPVSVCDRKLRNKILDRSEKMGLGIMPGYPDSINRIPELKHQFKGQAFPVAQKLSETLITLPAHSLVSRKDKKRIIEMISDL